jgi:Ca2+-binding EF-hand superfamily protein
LLVKSLEYALQEIKMWRSLCCGNDVTEALTLNQDNEEENPIITDIRNKIGEKPLLQYFKTYDKDGSGFIDKGELRRFLRMHGIIYMESDFTSFLQVYDVNNDGKLSYNEFLKAFHKNIHKLGRQATALSMKLVENGLSNSFDLMDKDNSSMVDRGEMRRLLRMKNIPYSEEEFEAVFQLYDLNGDGKLNFEEFSLVMTKQGT